MSATKKCELNALFLVYVLFFAQLLIHREGLVLLNSSLPNSYGEKIKDISSLTI